MFFPLSFWTFALGNFSRFVTLWWSRKGTEYLIHLTNWHMISHNLFQMNIKQDLLSPKAVSSSFTCITTSCPAAAKKECPWYSDAIWELHHCIMIVIHQTVKCRQDCHFSLWNQKHEEKCNWWPKSKIIRQQDPDMLIWGEVPCPAKRRVLDALMQSEPCSTTLWQWYSSSAVWSQL